MIYLRVCVHGKTTGATSGPGTTYPIQHHLSLYQVFSGIAMDQSLAVGLFIDN